MTTRPYRIAGGLIALATVVAATPALAAEAGTMDRIVDLYRDGAANWEAAIAQAAMRLFFLLAVIEVAWTSIKLGMKNADWGEWVAELVNRTLYVGFFGWLLTNAGDFTRAIINSFRQIGDAASTAGGGSGGIRPSDIFDSGLTLATGVLNAKVEAGLAGIGQHIALMLTGAVILICFALMAAFLIIALVESYVITSAGVLMFAFGGSRLTKDYAVKALTYGVSVGAKLMVIQLLVGLGEATVESMAASLDPVSLQKPEDVFVMLGFAVVLLCLVKTVPEHVQALINGVSMSTAGGGMLASAVGGAVGGAVGAAAGMASAGVNAARLASQQLKGEAGGDGKGPGLRALAARTAGNLGSAAAADLGARLGGHARSGSMGGRMGLNMDRQRRELVRADAKPMPPVAANETKAAETVAASAAASAEGVIRPAATANAGGGATGAASARSSSAVTPESAGRSADQTAPGASDATRDDPAGSPGAETVPGASAGGATKPAATAGHEGSAAPPTAAAAAAAAATEPGANETVQGAHSGDTGPPMANSGLGGRLGGSNPERSKPGPKGPILKPGEK